MDWLMDAEMTLKIVQDVILIHCQLNVNEMTILYTASLLSLLVYIFQWFIK